MMMVVVVYYGDYIDVYLVKYLASIQQQYIQQVFETKTKKKSFVRAFNVYGVWAISIFINFLFCYRCCCPNDNDPNNSIEKSYCYCYSGI